MKMTSAGPVRRLVVNYDDPSVPTFQCLVDPASTLTILACGSNADGDPTPAGQEFKVPLASAASITLSSKE